MASAKGSKVFQSAFEAVLESSGIENEAMLGLYNLACDVDNLRSRVVDGARDAARDMLDLAERLRTGRVDSSNPCASSRIYDLPMNVAMLEAKRQAFHAMARALLSAEKYEALKAVLVEEFSSLEDGASGQVSNAIYALGK